jgi:hypothetical protein
MSFKPNRKFRKKYDRLFRENPLGANTFLLLCELADENGQVFTSPHEIAEKMANRFNDPEEYAL